MKGEGGLENKYEMRSRSYDGASSRFPSWAKKGAVISLIGLMIAFLGTGDASPYWACFLQITGAVLTAGGLFLIIISMFPE